MARTDREQLPILTYHSVDDSGSAISVSPRRFLAQMADLDRRGFPPLGLSELIMQLDDKRPWSSSNVLIMFDDALCSITSTAKPILDRFGFRACVAVVTSRVGLDNGWAGQPTNIPRLPVLSWRELEALKTSGWDIISHTHTHPRMERLAEAEVEAECEASILTLERYLGPFRRALAYPYGKVNEAGLGVVRQCFEAAFEMGNRPAQPCDDRHRLPRIEARYYLPGLPFCRPGSLGFVSYLRGRETLRKIAKKDEGSVARPAQDVP